ncbi:hypothetical protein KC357_g6439 [Hortaea werneckii]|nr:hypothetical protein KC357_g6439 [Hortaea werneckii]
MASLAKQELSISRGLFRIPPQDGLLLTTTSNTALDESEAFAMTDFSSFYDAFDDPALRHGFRNLDDPAQLGNLMETVQRSSTSNFVLDFSDASASVAFDLSTSSLANLLNAEQPETAMGRWINIFYPYQHRPLLELLAKRYDFSPRQLGLMCSDPLPPRRSPHSSQTESAQSKHFWRRRLKSTSLDSDIEKNLDELSEHSSISSYDSAAKGNLYRIVDDVWHYTSVDFGRNYTCIGYNSLVWTWLLLCRDDTVITINEDPFPAAQGRLDAIQRRILKETRRNLANVFRALSKIEEDQLLTQNPMTLLPIRTRLGDTPEETAHRETDAPGLLFYYLFENWHNSYTLITRKESRYGIELTDLRKQMMLSPQLSHIDRLDGIGRELGVLKRHYQSYTRIVDRLLEPRPATAASLENSRIASSETSQASLDTVRPLITERESMLGVSLSSAARLRFKRFKDQIDLYALSEVDDYMKQKESLIAMNFNLIAMKESVDMERLTRVTLLLTKATILFLPVSLMSAYFSIDLTGERYTVTEYWVSFGIILFCSWVALFLFGVLSGSVQTVVVLRNLWRGVKKFGNWLSCAR